ncbi:hypothetical protein B484DRAFT_328167 [Ochromonadaceae sp. CCMP2298]|nr:hypothetical protein B484DRAFT_328167 [Ochromonadaceae sp. CCMP2298]
MVDRELGKPIGLLTLADNSPRHLTLRIEHLWLTPAFQNRGRSLEALMLVLQWLMAAGYRRITAEVDERHLIGRKLLLSAGFLLEAVLRKHKIIQNRNSNTALYVLLNSEWELAQEKLRRKLGIKVKGGVKVAGVVGGVGVRGAVSASAPISAPAPALASASDGSNSSRSGDSSSISNNSSNSSSSSSRRKKKSKGDA